MIVITGAAGFIGWNLHLALKDREELLLVDLKDKFVDNFITTHPTADPFVFLEKLKDSTFASKIKVIFHQGACSDTTVYDPHYMFKYNFDYSAQLLRLCLRYGIRLIYASSASVYGDGPFDEITAQHLRPKNLYARSKKLFDDYAYNFLDSLTTSPQIVGLRYFNVYGPHEAHKGMMASVMCQFRKQITKHGRVYLFEHSKDYLRDFIYVEDVVKVNLHFLDNAGISGIFNCGTGTARPFTDISACMRDHFNFEVKEKKMPIQLMGKYQRFTKASLSKLRSAGRYKGKFLTLEEGIGKYAEFWQTR
tara:strand:- start:8593 stop:9510 length:918 start_codon:yes stop_codon:yes gene_type:complete